MTSAVAGWEVRGAETSGGFFESVLRRALVAAGEAPATPGAPGQPSPLFLAEVDEVDTTAVLALLAIVPTDEGKSLRVFERRDGQWNEVPEYVKLFKSIDPPTVVELDLETLLQVLEQLDLSDSDKK